MFYEIDSLTNFAIFKGKHLYWSFFLILKRDANADVSCEYSEMFSFLQFFYIEHLFIILFGNFM